jgi:hypothetical protein
MAEASAGFIQALDGLRRAATAELSGNAYYLAMGRIEELEELAGSKGALLPEAGAPIDLRTALTEARNRAVSELASNAYSLAAKKLDALAFLTAAHSGDGTQGSERKTAVGPAVPTRSFDDLATASKARVEQVASELGIARHAPVQTNAIMPETRADGELERRSSEPCFASEVRAPDLDPVAAPAVSTQGIARSATVESANRSGPPSPDLQRDHGQGANCARPACDTGSTAVAQDSAPEHDRAALAAGETVTRDKADETKRAEGKSLFTLWLDLLFGKKDERV